MHVERFKRCCQSEKTRLVTRKEVVMKTDEPIPSRTIREWCKDSAYVDAVREGSEQLLQRPLEVDALLVGIRFLHNFVKTPRGELVVQKTLDEGFLQLVPGSDGTQVYGIPRLLWPDRFYDDLCPGKADHVSIGIQIARYMLWGPPNFFEKRRSDGRRWDSAVRKALNRFDAELRRRRRQSRRPPRRPGSGNPRGTPA